MPEIQSLVDIDFTAERLGTTPRHIRSLIAERRLPFYKVGHFVRFDPAELDAWLASNKVEAVTS